MPFKWLKRRRNTLSEGERPRNIDPAPPVPPLPAYEKHRSVSANAAATVNGYSNVNGNGAARGPAPSPSPVPTANTVAAEPKIRRRKSFFGSLRRSKDKGKDDHRSRAASFSAPQDSAPLFNDAPPVPPLPSKLPSRLEPAAGAPPTAGARTGPKKRMSMIPRKPPPSAWNNGEDSDDDVAVPAGAPPPVPAKRQTMPAQSASRSISSPTPSQPQPQTRAPNGAPSGLGSGDFVAIDAMDRLDAMGEGSGNIGLGRPQTSRMSAVPSSGLRSASAPGGPTPTTAGAKRLSSPPPTSFANPSSRTAAKPSAAIPPMKKLPDLALDKALPDPRGSPDMAARKRMSVEPGFDPRRMSEIDRVPPTCPKYALGELPPPPADAPPTPQKEKRASVIMAEAAATKRSSLLPRAEPAAAVVPRRSPPRSPSPGPSALAAPSLDAAVVAPPDPFGTFGAATRPNVPGIGAISSIPAVAHAPHVSTTPMSALSSSRHTSLPRQAPPSVPVVPTPSELTRSSPGQTNSGAGSASGAFPRQAPPPGVEIVARPAALGGGGRVGRVSATPASGAESEQQQPDDEKDEKKDDDDDKTEGGKKEESKSGEDGKATKGAHESSDAQTRPAAAEVTAPVDEIGGPNKFGAQAQNDDALTMPPTSASAAVGENDAPGARSASRSSTTSPNTDNPRPAMSFVPPRMLARGGVAKVQGVYESRFGHPMPGLQGEEKKEEATSGTTETGETKGDDQAQGAGSGEEKPASEEKSDSAATREQHGAPSATASSANDKGTASDGTELPRTETFGRLPGAGTFGAHRPLSIVSTPTAPRVAEEPLDEEDELEDLDDGDAGRVAIDETAQVDAHARVEAPQDAPLTIAVSGDSSERSCESGSRSAVSPQDTAPPRLPSPVPYPAIHSRSVTPEMPDTPRTPEPSTPDTPAVPELVTPATPASSHLSQMSTTAAPPSPYTSSPLQPTRSVSASTPNRSPSNGATHGPPRPDSPDKPIDPDVRRMPSAANLRPASRRAVSSPTKTSAAGPGEPTLDEFMSLFRRVQARGQGVTIRAAAAAAEKKHGRHGPVDTRVGQAL